MVKIIQNPQQNYQSPAQDVSTRKVLRMIKNDRMAGSIPKWESVPNKSARPENAFALSTHHQTPRHDLHALLGYAPQNAAATPENRHLNNQHAHAEAPSSSAEDESFGFGDVIDMINPLQHIPIIGDAYRTVTGDDIKPSAKIIGSALIGGPLAVASSLIDTILQEETGHDIAQNALNFVTEGKTPRLKQSPIKIAENAAPEEQLSAAAQLAKNTPPARETTQATSAPQLPESLLAFTTQNPRHDIAIHRKLAASGRSAGETISYQEQRPPQITSREPITQVNFSADLIELLAAR